MNIDTNLILHAIPAFIFLSLVEGVIIVRETGFNKIKKDSFINVCLGLGFVALSPLTKAVNLVTYTFAYQHRLTEINTAPWVLGLICFAGDDFTYYWYHRVSHEVRFFWASHMVHHSSETYTLLAALRQSWTNNFTGSFLFWIWMPLVGFTPAMIVFIKSTSVIYQFWLHTEKIGKLPRWFGWVFNTPAYHRVHHASNIEYLDKNHGATMIIWDRLFGTFCEQTVKPVYGITKKINSADPVTITFFEWKHLFKDLWNAKSAKEFFSYLFNAPGWSKDGSSKTTRQLR